MNPPFLPKTRSSRDHLVRPSYQIDGRRCRPNLLRVKRPTQGGARLISPLHGDRQCPTTENLCQTFQRSSPYPYRNSRACPPLRISERPRISWTSNNNRSRSESSRMNRWNLEKNSPQRKRGKCNS